MTFQNQLLNNKLLETNLFIYLFIYSQKNIIIDFQLIESVE